MIAYKVKHGFYPRIIGRVGSLPYRPQKVLFGHRASRPLKNAKWWSLSAAGGPAQGFSTARTAVKAAQGGTQSPAPAKARPPLDAQMSVRCENEASRRLHI